MREFCHGPNALAWGLPSGGFDVHRHADAAAAAAAELSEEAHLTGGTWHRLTPPGSPGLLEAKWCANRFTPFLVVDPQAGGGWAGLGLHIGLGWAEVDGGARFGAVSGVGTHRVLLPRPQPPTPPVPHHSLQPDTAPGSRDVEERIELARVDVATLPALLASEGLLPPAAVTAWLAADRLRELGLL